MVGVGHAPLIVALVEMALVVVVESEVESVDVIWLDEETVVMTLFVASVEEGIELDGVDDIVSNEDTADSSRLAEVTDSLCELALLSDISTVVPWVV